MRNGVCYKNTEEMILNFGIIITISSKAISVTYPSVITGFYFKYKHINIYKYIKAKLINIYTFSHPSLTLLAYNLHLLHLPIKLSKSSDQSLFFNS